MLKQSSAITRPHRDSELLFASEVALSRLDGDVAEQKLDLIEFAAGEVAKASAGATEVVRGQLVGARARRRCSDDVPKHLR
jgi:hypothetical protein